MKDLVAIMEDEEAMIKMGFKMKSEDEPKEKNERYSKKGISQYTRIISVGGFFKYAPKDARTRRNN
jgi:hypothetical protein